jgi:predicted SAM-dependent methyltransferase/ADP-heptose:LPS heptosyltransferase
MVWDPRTSQGNESAKIRFEVLPYLAKGGLDIGCGASKVWPHLIGIDSTKDSGLFGVEMRPDLVVPDASKLPIFTDGSAENIFSSHLLEHIEEWQDALREWWRLLKVGGHMILYLPHADLYPRIGQPGANPDHKHDFEPESIVDFFRLAFPDWSLIESQTRGDTNEYSFLLVLRKGKQGSGQSEPWLSPRSEKRAGIVRMGGNGDALWAASAAAHLHDAGYEVTVYCAENGEEVLRHDPHIAHIRTLPQGILTDDESIEFWAICATKFDRWVNLHGSVEGRLLPHQSEHAFYLPHHVRHRLMNHNYVDMVHTYAELPADALGRQKFYPTAAEHEWAKAMRARLPGPMVFLSPSGSGSFKAWPHAEKFMGLMADTGVYTLLVGDIKTMPKIDHVERNGQEFGIVVGQEWPLRLAMTMAQYADVVVSTESVFANAVAMEPMHKIVMLSHSSVENLTRDWINTCSLEAPVACHPCHRIHNAAASLCARDTTTKASACMAWYAPEIVADLAHQALALVRQKEAA